MSYQRTEDLSQLPVSTSRQMSDEARYTEVKSNAEANSNTEAQSNDAPPSDVSRRDGDNNSPSGDSSRGEANAQPGDTVRVEITRDKEAKNRDDNQPRADKRSAKTSSDSKPSSDSKATPEAKSPPKAVSAAKVKKQSRLPALDDDGEVGVQKEQIVTRDGKADLAFTGTLLASAAPSPAPKEQWQEYRVYETSGGKHVFSKVTRTIFAEENDTFEAEVFDPSPSSMPSQLLRSAREIAHGRPLTWTDAAAAFFGYDPLAKVLYRKLGGQFEERVG